jgi:hypothetical protein
MIMDLSFALLKRPCMPFCGDNINSVVRVSVSPNLSGSLEIAFTSIYEKQATPYPQTADGGGTTVNQSKTAPGTLVKMTNSCYEGMPFTFISQAEPN